MPQPGIQAFTTRHPDPSRPQDFMIKPRIDNPHHLYSNRNVPLPGRPHNGLTKMPSRPNKKGTPRPNKLPPRPNKLPPKRNLLPPKRNHVGMMRPKMGSPSPNHNRIVNMHSLKMNPHDYMELPSPIIEDNRMVLPNPTHENRMVNMNNISPNSEYNRMMMASAGQEQAVGGCGGCVAGGFAAAAGIKSSRDLSFFNFFISSLL